VKTSVISLTLGLLLLILAFLMADAVEVVAWILMLLVLGGVLAGIVFLFVYPLHRALKSHAAGNGLVGIIVYVVLVALLTFSIGHYTGAYPERTRDHMNSVLYFVLDVNDTIEMRLCDMFCNMLVPAVETEIR
jgi:ABC-type phosphate transport system permease subunit